MFWAFLAHLQECLGCIVSRGTTNICWVIQCGVQWDSPGLSVFTWHLLEVPCKDGLTWTIPLDTTPYDPAYICCTPVNYGNKALLKMGKESPKHVVTIINKKNVHTVTSSWLPI